jgi:sugar phosphate isomerase/epimerase
MEQSTTDRGPVILASFHTIAGQVQPEVREGNQVSPHDIAARIEAAAEAGYRGIGFADPDLAHYAQLHGIPQIRSWVEEAGIEVVELEMLHDWYAEGEAKAASDALAAQLIEWAGELGARHIKIGTGFSGLSAERSRLVAGLAELADKAADSGARLALEPMPPAGISDPLDGLALIEEAGVSNAGLFIDVWHMVRADIDFESLRKIPGERLVAVELMDAAAEPVEGDLFLDGCDFRTPAGTGEFDLDRFLAAVLSTGFYGPFGDENLSIENRERPLAEAARVNFDATHAAVRRALRS